MTEAREVIGRLVGALKDNVAVVRQFEHRESNTAVEVGNVQSDLAAANDRGNIEKGLRKFY